MSAKLSEAHGRMTAAAGWKLHSGWLSVPTQRATAMCRAICSSVAPQSAPRRSKAPEMQYLLCNFPTPPCGRSGFIRELHCIHSIPRLCFQLLPDRSRRRLCIPEQVSRSAHHRSRLPILGIHRKVSADIPSRRAPDCPHRHSSARPITILDSKAAVLRVEVDQVVLSFSRTARPDSTQTRWIHRARAECF